MGKDMTEFLGEISEELQKKLYAQNRIAGILNQDITRHKAILKSLEVLGKTFGWPVGFYWALNRKKERLELFNYWAEDFIKYKNLISLNLDLNFIKGTDWFNKVYEKNDIDWPKKFLKNSKISRVGIAHKLGLNSIVTYPIYYKNEIIGVIEFFAKNSSWNSNLEDFLPVISNQLAQFLRLREVEYSSELSSLEFKTVLLNVPVGIAVEDEDGKILYANDTLAYAFGEKSALSLINKNEKYLYRNFKIASSSGKTLEINDLPSKKVFKSGREKSRLVCFRNKETEEEKWFLLKVTPIDDLDHPTLIIKSYHDLTREIEEERSQELLTSIMGHELRNPLASIMAYTELLKKRHKEKNYTPFDRYLTSMDAQNRRLLGIINNIIDATRLRGKVFKIRKTYFDIDQMLAATINNFKVTAPDFKIRKKGKIKNKYYGDEDRISQIIINLLSNATKFSPKNKDIVVRSWNGRDNINIGIKDRGIGIPKRNLKKIFNLKNTLPKKGGGVGLGLVISQGIAKAHGGQITVKSRQRAGSEFILTLPKT